MAICVPLRKPLYPAPPALSGDGEQVRMTCDEVTAVAVRPVGGEGGVVSVGTTPVPVKRTAYALVAVMMLSVPVALPPATGANDTKTSQCVPGVMTPFQLPLAWQ